MNIFNNIKNIFSNKSTTPVSSNKKETTVKELEELPVGTFVVLEMNKDRMKEAEMLHSSRYDSKVLSEGILRGLIKAKYKDDTGLFQYMEIVGVPDWGKRQEYSVFQYEVKKVALVVKP